MGEWGAKNFDRTRGTLTREKTRTEFKTLRRNQL